MSIMLQESNWMERVMENRMSLRRTKELPTKPAVNYFQYVGDRRKSVTGCQVVIENTIASSSSKLPISRPSILRSAVINSQFQGVTTNENSLNGWLWRPVEERLARYKNHQNLGVGFTSVSESAIDAVVGLIDSLKRFSALPSTLVPTSDGGFLLDVTIRKINLEWEVDENAELAVMIVRPGEAPLFLDLELQKVSEFLGNLQSYV